MAIVEIGSVALNWKSLAVIGSTLLGAVGVTYGYIDGVDERLDKGEVARTEIVEEIQTNRCMLLKHDAAEEPLECLTEIEVP
jgi:hypothetical protein